MLKRIFVIFFAFLLPLNTAAAVSSGICDVLEQSQPHTFYIGYHCHEHNDGHDIHPMPDTDNTGMKHCCDHVHPNLSFIASAITAALPPFERPSLIASPSDNFKSLPQTPPYHPPRAVLA